MPEYIDKQILEKVKKACRGSLFFSENFIVHGNADAIRKALEMMFRSTS